MSGDSFACSGVALVAGHEVADLTRPEMAIWISNLVQLATYNGRDLEILLASWNFHACRSFCAGFMKYLTRSITLLAVLCGEWTHPLGNSSFPIENP